jgi:hypothetical protein
MDDCHRNQEIAELLTLWEWCSAKLHTKWCRRQKSRNSFLMALAYVVSQPNPISPFEFVKVYQRLPHPLLDQKKVRAFWDVQPIPLLEACLGSFSVETPMKVGLNDIRSRFLVNPTLDKIVKTMRAREKRFGPDWHIQGHHPEQEFVALKKGTTALRSALRIFFVKKYRAIDKLALRILSHGGWQFGELPASSRVRRTPPTLLNEVTRLKLWDAAHEILEQYAGDRDATLEKLCSTLYRKITPSIRSSIESQGYSVDHVIDDLLNFDVSVSRGEIINR